MKSFFKNKFMQKDRKMIVLYTVLFSMILVFVFGMMYAFAYYNKSAAFTLISSTIGDFEQGTGDINIMVYIENDTGGYNLIKSIPSFGYILNDSKTECDADYTINGSNEINVTSNKKVTCKFYFKKLTDADVKVLVMVEDDEGIYEYDNKLYKLSDYIPAYGYDYKNYACTNTGVPVNLRYDANTRNFTLDTNSTNLCYAYFNNIGIVDVNVNVFIREDLSTNKYVQVESIPSLRTYKLSTSTTSYCKNKDGTTSSDVISYTNGQIKLSSTAPESCYVYLDVVS